MRLVDLWDAGRPIAGIEVRFGSGGLVTTLSDGSFTLPQGFNEPIEVATESIRLVFSGRPLGGARDDGNVLIWRRVRVEGSVVDETHTPIRERCSVAAAPVVTTALEWISSPERVGSLPWIQRNVPELSQLPASVSGGQFHVDVPACSSVAFVASAAGFLPETQTLDLSGGHSPQPLVLTLRRQGTVELRLTDETGNPIAGATAQYFCIRRGSRASISPDIELLVQSVAGSGCAMHDFPAKGTADVAHLHGGTTNVDGVVVLKQLASSTEQFVIVWAPERAPEVVRSGDSRWRDGILELRMEKVVPLVEKYRFLDRGAPLLGVEIAILEDIDGFTPGRAPARVDKDGYVSSAFIVPGRQYRVLIFRGRDTFSGPLTFGADSEVEVSQLLLPR